MTAPLTRSGRPNTSGTRGGLAGGSPFPLAEDGYNKDNEQKFRSQLGDAVRSLRLGGTSSFRGIINLLDYGAAGDGSTDDTAAVQSAIDALPATGGAGTIFAPAGQYLCSSAINPGNRQVILQGVGWIAQAGAPFGHASWLAADAVQGTVFKFSNTTGSGILRNSSVIYGGLSLRDLAVLGPGSGTSVGVNIEGGSGGSNRNLFHNVLVANFAKGVRFNVTLDNTYYNLFTWSCADGLYYDESGIVTDQYFYRIDIQGCTRGIYGRSGGGQNFYGGLIQGNTTGVLLEAPASGLVNWYMDGIWSEANTTSIKLDGTASQIQSCGFSNWRNVGGPITLVNAGGLVRIHFLNVFASGVTLTLPAAMSNSVIVGGKVDALINNSPSTAILGLQADSGDVTSRIAWATSVVDLAGTGTPEGAVTAKIGSTFRRLDGGASTSFYVKESGTGNVGWVGK